MIKQIKQKIKENIALMKIGFKIALAYRFHGVINLIMTPISLVVFYFLWKSIYSYTGQTLIRGFTFQALIGYYVLSMIVAFLTWSHSDKWLEHQIRHGDLIFKLVQPLTHIKNEYFSELGVHSFTVIMEIIPLFIIGVLFFHLPLASITNTILFLVSLIMANVLYFQMTYLVGLSAFWLKRIDGVRRMRTPLIAFLSGGILPLTFFPMWYTNIHHLLPFQYVRYVPIMIYLGGSPLTKSLMLMLGQLIWILLFYVIIKIVWDKGYKKFSGVGT